MHTNAPEGYLCPLCCIAQGIEREDFPYTKQQDIFYQDTQLTAFVSSHWWPNNRGHVIIIPNRHTENLYDMPDEELAAIHSLSRTIALAFKETYGCDGVSTRQHNEPAGDQDVWHYHLHVFPRYLDDQLYIRNAEKFLSHPAERLAYAEKLRGYFQKHYKP